MGKTKAKRAKRVFGFTDIHWSERDPRALALAMEAHKVFKPDHTVIGGDLLNASPFSRHPKRTLDEDAEYDYVNDELDPARGFLDTVQSRTIGGQLTILEGNHDAWFERWIRNSDAGRGAALKSLLPKNYLTKGRKNCRWVPWNDFTGDRKSRLFLHPKLMVVHGWCANKYAGERHLQMAKPYSVIFHHSHRAEQRIATMADGHIVTALNGGCLCKLTPTYNLDSAPSEWSQGFWVAYVGEESFTTYIVPIIKGGCVLPDGTEVKL